MLVTAAAAPLMAIVHHRQPLCLEDDEVNAWLDPATPLADIEAILAAAAPASPASPSCAPTKRAHEARRTSSGPRANHQFFVRNSLPAIAN